MGGVLRDLPEYDVSGSKMHEPLPLGPKGLEHGRFANGLTYYIRHCSKPAKRACLKLVVKIGSLVEQEHERGVAHILEHLAFNGTEVYSNHEVIAQLEALGCEFGPCQNAYTSVEETVYELFVPTDEEHLVQQAAAVFREFAFKIRCGVEDLQRERGPVLQEMRAGRDAFGRGSSEHWKLMLAGSKHADRMPIGLESVIKRVPAATLKAFYDRWYHPHNMAVVAIGDFADLGQVRQVLSEALGVEGMERGPATPIPQHPWLEHAEPRAKVTIDKENGQTTVSVSFKVQQAPLVSPADYLQHIQEDVLHMVVNRRFNAVSRRVGCPFYVAVMSREPLLQGCTVHNLQVVPLDGRLEEALNSVLTELARLRLHGFSNQEFEMAERQYLAEVENLYLERDEVDSGDVAEEYVRNFTSQELVIGAEAEARLTKTLLSMVKHEAVAEICSRFKSSQSCTIKVQSHDRATTVEKLLQEVEKVNAAEAGAGFAAWQPEAIPEKLLPTEPAAGTITAERQLSTLSAVQLELSNGMRVCYRKSMEHKDQVVFSGFAVGGLSEVSEAQFRSMGLANVLANEVGAFGFKPHVLQDILVGRRVDVRTSLEYFWRSIGGSFSPLELDMALQLVHKLFITEVKPVEEDLASTIAMLRHMVDSQFRDPMTRFGQYLKQLTYGRSHLFKLTTQADLDALDPEAACSHFTRAFQNPAEFTLCFVGNLDDGAFKQAVKKNLASIPRAADREPMPLEAVTPIDFTLAPSEQRRSLLLPLMEPVAQVQVTFPLEIPQEAAVEEGWWCTLLSKLIEQRLMRRLRFREGMIYSCSVSAFFGLEAPSRRECVRGDLGISFSCAPAQARALAALALGEVAALQQAGPGADEVATLLTIEQRQFEVDQQEDAYWLDVIVNGYKSRLYRDLHDVDRAVSRRLEARVALREKTDSATLLAAVKRVLPLPCTRRCTVAFLLPDGLFSRVGLCVDQYPVYTGVFLAGLVALGGVACVHARRR